LFEIIFNNVNFCETLIAFFYHHSIHSFNKEFLIEPVKAPKYDIDIADK